MESADCVPPAVFFSPVTRLSKSLSPAGLAFYLSVNLFTKKRQERKVTRVLPEKQLCAPVLPQPVSCGFVGQADRDLSRTSRTATSMCESGKASLASQHSGTSSLIVPPGGSQVSLRLYLRRTLVCSFLSEDTVPFQEVISCCSAKACPL